MVFSTTLVRSVAVAAALLVAAAAAAQPGGGETPLDRAALAARVREETRFAWQSYVAHAWGHDELRPKSLTARDWYGPSLLLTPVDALDTLLLLGLDGEAAQARELIVTRLRFDHDVAVQNFEITIRLLGGLLSGYQLTGDSRLLRLADELGARLLPVFDAPTGMPLRFVNLRTGATSGRISNPAEIGTLLLEWGALGRLTGKPVYFDRAKRALLALAERRSPAGLVGSEINVATGRWKERTSHVGGGIDSYYEYLLKGALLFGDPDCRRLWEAAKQALDRHLAETVGGRLWYGPVAMRTGRRAGHAWGALEAFLPGVLALDGDLEAARRLQASNAWMWSRHRLEPDGFDYAKGRVTFPRYPLRPEIVESTYVLYRRTHDPAFLAMGRTFFEDLVAASRTPNGYTVVEDVTTKRQGDLMPSYFLAETLKYLYLLFAPDDAFDFDGVVFNTEAHPLRRTW